MLKKILAMGMSFILAAGVCGCSLIEKKNKDGLVDEIGDGIFIKTRDGKYYEPNLLNQSFQDKALEVSTSRYIYSVAGNKAIPVLYADDELIIVSKESLPGTLSAEEFIYLGDSLGLYGLYYDDSNMLTADKNCLIPGSSAAKLLASNMTQSGWKIESVNGRPVGEDNVSVLGTIPGENEGDIVTLGVYQGTRFAEAEIECDTKIYVSFDVDISLDYDMTKEGYAKIDVSSLKSGFYSINGAGLLEVRVDEKRISDHK